jgi:small-conductance mechanosensitive channel
MTSLAARRPRFENLEQIIARMTLAIGSVAAITIGLLHGWMWASGVAIGAGLSWLSFRWLKHGTDALRAVITAREGEEKPRVPVTIYLKAVLRYGLMGLIIYAIFEYLKVPVLSMITGLLALGAATFLASLYEILRPVD